MRFTFFHAADIHLGAASEGVMRGAPAHIKKAIDECTYQAFENLIRDAEAQKPAFVLFPGDVYNSADENLRARLALRDGILRLDALGIPSVLICGNHDPLRANDALVLPESCHRFGVHDRAPLTLHHAGAPVAQVYGESYPSPRVPKNLAKAYPKVSAGEGGLLQIAMLHGNLKGQRSLGAGEKNANDYAPFALEDLQERGYDYWALGHVHAYRVLCRAPSWAVYSGSLQGVSPRERGVHGYVEVSVDGNRVREVSLKEADVLRWAEFDVDLTGAESINALEDRVDSVLRNLIGEASGRPTVARVHLTGDTSLDADLRKDDFEAQVKRLRHGYAMEEPFLWFESCEVETRPEIDWDAIRASQSVQSYILRLAESPYEEFRDSIPQLLKEVMGRGKLELPEAEELEALLTRAAQRAVGMLQVGSGK